MRSVHDEEQREWTGGEQLEQRSSVRVTVQLRVVHGVHGEPSDEEREPRWERGKQEQERSMEREQRDELQ